MRVLALDTSTAVGSVAVVEDGRFVAGSSHRELHRHAELMLPMVESVLASAGWSKGSLDRVAVGVGPGSFTGLRVGIALAEGMATGLTVPLVGIGSLRAQAASVPAHEPGLRVVLRDARRGDVYAAAYDAPGGELLAPSLMSAEKLRIWCSGLAAEKRIWLLGEVGLLGQIELLARGAEGFEVVELDPSDLPDAHWIALLAAEEEPATAAPVPLYVRDAGATEPTLPPSPFGG